MIAGISNRQKKPVEEPFTERFYGSSFRDTKNI